MSKYLFYLSMFAHSYQALGDSQTFQALDYPRVEVISSAKKNQLCFYKDGEYIASSSQKHASTKIFQTQPSPTKAGLLGVALLSGYVAIDASRLAISNLLTWSANAGLMLFTAIPSLEGLSDDELRQFIWLYRKSATESVNMPLHHKMHSFIKNLGYFDYSKEFDHRAAVNLILTKARLTETDLATLRGLIAANPKFKSAVAQGVEANLAYFVESKPLHRQLRRTLARAGTAGAVLIPGFIMYSVLFHTKKPNANHWKTFQSNPSRFSSKQFQTFRLSLNPEEEGCIP